MAEIVVMPKIGLTAREALLKEWLVQEGDVVSEGDVLFEIETDKIASEVESPASGVLLRRIEPDVVVSVGSPIAVIGEAGEDVSDVTLFSPAETPSAEEEAEPSSEDARPVGTPADAGDIRLKASPAARNRAKELGIDLATISGSGPGGRITQKDIDLAVQARPGSEAPSVASVARTEEPTRLRRAIAEAMSISAAIPQFSLERDVDITDLRAALVARSSDPERSISVADAIGAATARAIRMHGVFLRSWDEGMFRYADGVHLGLAVAVDGGLIVPVLRDADLLSVDAFSEARRDLQERTLEGKLRAEEATGAVFTISNLGPLGVDRFRALVNPPESGILALGRARVVDGRQIVAMNLSADHRVVDGAQGARLLSEIVRLIEDQEGRAGLLSSP
jgi:pyruvate dehydrogenase E2 component (dihydrolipoyllysine-residue acetyltransferase)